MHLHAQCASGETHDKRDTLAKRAGKFKFKSLEGIPRDVALGVLSDHYSLSAHVITAGSFQKLHNSPTSNLFSLLIYFCTLSLHLLSQVFLPPLLSLPIPSLKLTFLHAKLAV